MTGIPDPDDLDETPLLSKNVENIPDSIQDPRSPRLPGNSGGVIWQAPTSRRIVPPEVIEVAGKCRHCGSTALYNDTRTRRGFCARCGRNV